ncbi:MAG: CBS domain-containing protein [Leptolyngbya sp. SIO4C1]|nr:CBS domain-containing protein [Leptolyngbya sp. SIO4C1]
MTWLKPSLSASLKSPQWLIWPKRVAIAQACLIGVVSGLTAVILKQSISGLAAWRSSWEAPTAWLFLPAFGLLGGWFAGQLVARLGPETSGSGIPYVKAVLGYVPLPLNLRVALVKLLGTLMAIGSGLSLGRQGPTIQIGAALAAQISHWIPTSPAFRRQLICAGAAAGLAAGFNAPIAGMLFVVEELLQDFSGLTLGTAILAAFIGAVVSRLLGGEGLNSTMATLPTHFALVDLPFMLLLGLLAGLLGALFSRGIFAGLALFQRFPLALPLRVGLAGLVTASLGLLLPVAAQDNTGLREFLVTGELGWQLVLAAFIAKFGLTLLAYSSGAPGGVFAPALVLGSALGCLVGFFAQALQGLPLVGDAVSANLTTYALAGMGAFFSAVAQVPMTSMVIVFEMTTDFNLVLPLMIGTAVAYLVSDRIASGSIYSRLLAWQGITLEADGVQTNLWTQLTADDLMVRQVETLPSEMPLTEAMQAFSQSHHRGFPVMANGKLVGIVTQSDLAKAPQQRDRLVRDVMTTPPVTVTPSTSITHVLHLLNQLKLSRLPVTDAAKLVGIITRGDIIRAESEHLSGEAAQPGPTAAPSYLVYQTQAPATGQGRLLIPLSNPQTTPELMRLAIAIARVHHYEIECVHILTVPQEVKPAEAQIDTAAGQRLLQQAQAAAAPYGLSVHTQIRVAHNVAQALLEVVKVRHGNLLLIGWQQPSLSSGRVFGSVVDTMIRQAPCHVIVARLGKSLRFKRWLLPIAGGPNSEQAIMLLPALLTLGPSPAVSLCHICGVGQRRPPFLAPIAAQLRRRLRQPVETIVAISDDPAQAIARLSQQQRSDVILLGASREGLLAQMIKGNLPRRVAQESDCTLLLVRQAASQGLG